MATRADWRIPSLGLDEEADPFSSTPSDGEFLPIEQVGTPIDLTCDTAKLREDLADLLKREGRLFDAGVTCPIKDANDSSCSACPLSKATSDDPLSPLCRIGARQERVLTELVIAKNNGS